MALLLSLMFLFGAQTIRATEHVWSGAGGNKLFSNPANWSSGGLPRDWEDPMTLRFPANGTDFAIVDIAGLKVDDLVIDRQGFKLGGTNQAKLFFASGTNWFDYCSVQINATNASFLSSLEFVLQSNVWVTGTGIKACVGDVCEDINGSVKLECKFSGPGLLGLEGMATYEFAGPFSNTHSGGTHICSPVYLNKPAGVHALPSAVVVDASWPWYADDRYQGRLTWKASHQIANSAAVESDEATLDLNGANEIIGALDISYGVVETGSGLLTLNGDIECFGYSRILGRLDLGTLPTGGRYRTISVFDELEMRASMTAPAGTALRKYGGGILNLCGTNSYTGSTYISGGTLRLHYTGTLGSTAGAIIIAGSGRFAVASSRQIYNPISIYADTNAPAQANIVVEADAPDGGGTYWSSTAHLSGPLEIEGPAGVSAHQISDNTPITLILSAGIAGNGSLTKFGSGLLQFTGSANNTFTGGLFVDEGRVELRRPNGATTIPGPLSIGTSEDDWVEAEGVFSYFNHQIADQAHIFVRKPGVLFFHDVSDTIGGIELEGGWIGTATGILTLNGDITVHPSQSLSYLAGNVNLGNIPHALDIADGAAPEDFGIYATITGGANGSITKYGPGTMRLPRASTYPGWTFVAHGKLVVAHPQALGGVATGTSVSPGATLELATGNASHGEPLLLNSAIVSLPLVTTNVMGGPITLMGSNRIDVAEVDALLTFTNVLSGPGGFTKVGYGNMELAGTATNTYSGRTRIENGPVRLKKPANVTAISGNELQIAPPPSPVNPPTAELFAPSQIGNSCAVTILGNGSLRHNGWSEVIGSLAGNGAVQLGSGQLTCGSLNTDTAFGGSITGTGATCLQKVGTGTLTMTGVSSMSGKTFLQGGKLMINGVLGSGAVMVNNGAILGGSGTVAQISGSGGSINPGNSVGILKSGAVTWSPSHSFRVELHGTTPGAGHDQLQVAGTVNLGGAALHASLGFNGAVSNQFVIVANDGTDSITGTFSGLPEGATLTLNAAQFKISYVGGTGNDVVLTQQSLSTPPKSSGITKLPNGQTQIGGEGVAGQLYNVQANVDFNTNNWVHIGTATADVTGKFSFIDTNAPNFPVRFYRFQIP